MSKTRTLATLSKRIKDAVLKKKTPQDDTGDHDRPDTDGMTLTDVRRGESRRVRPSLNAP